MPSQRYVPQLEVRQIKQSFSSLIDAMICMRRSQVLDGEILEANNLMNRKVVSLEKVKVELSESIDRLKGNLGEANVQALSKQVIGFTDTALDQIKQKITQETQQQLALLESDTSSEKTKTTKSIEAFLVTAPFPIIDRSIVVKLQDGAYAGKARFRCQNDVQYEFSLDSRPSLFFRGQYRLGMFDRGLRIPVGLGKSWLKKEPVPDFLSIEQFVLISAEATDTTLMVNCSDTEKDSNLKLVYTRHGNHSSLTLQYSQGDTVVDLTSEPGLNAHLDSDVFIRFMEKLWLGMNDLERRKISLTKVVVDSKSILEELDCAEFFARSWQVLAPRVREIVKASSPSPEGRKITPLASDSEALDEKTVKEKLKSLGSQAAEIAQLVGLNID